LRSAFPITLAATHGAAFSILVFAYNDQAETLIAVEALQVLDAPGCFVN